MDAIGSNASIQRTSAAARSTPPPGNAPDATPVDTLTSGTLPPLAAPPSRIAMPAQDALLVTARPLQATLYKCQDDGTFVRTEKYNTCLTDQRPVRLPGTSDHVFTGRGPHGPVLIRANALGQAVFSVPVDLNVDRHSITCGADGSRIYAMDKHAAFAFDSASGRQIRREPLPSGTWSAALEPQADGSVLLAVGEELKRFDGDLAPLATSPAGFAPSDVRALPSGGTVLVDSVYGRSVALHDASGKVLFRRGDDRTHMGNPQIDSSGSLWLRESRDSGESRVAVTRYDASTGTTRTFSVADASGYVYPRPDGSFAVLEQPRAIDAFLALYDRDGKLVRRFKPDVEGGAEQTVVSSDGRTAYMMIHPYRPNASGPRPQTLYRFDLDRDGSTVGDGLGWIAQKVGISAGGTRIYEGDEAAQTFFPVLLDDGRLLMFKRDGIDLVDGSGSTLQHFSDRASLDAALGDVRPVGSPETYARQPARSLDEHLLEWRRRTTWLDLEPFLSHGTARVAHDGTTSISTVMAAETARQEMGLTEEAQVDSLTEALTSKLFSTPLAKGEERTIPFPSQDGSRIVVSAFHLSIETPHPGGAPGQYDRISYCLDDELRETFSLVLPVQVGDRHFALAASSEGRVSWLESRPAGRDENLAYNVMYQPRYEVGSPVLRLSAGTDRLYALAQDGSVLSFQPPLAPGETLMHPGLQDGGRVAGTAEEKRVIVSDAEVSIGGIKLPRRQAG